MHKKISTLLISLLTIIAILFSFTGCSEEFVEEISSAASSIAEETFDTTEYTELESETTVESTSTSAEETTTASSTEETTTVIETTETTEITEITEALLDADASYTTKEDVSLYIYQYGTLPNNFITKKEARALGWEGGSLEDYAPGMCIGGDYFGNYEGLLPEESGRTYYECDIDTLGASSRGAKRIIFSNDGLIYYTSDHYESFTLLYGEE